MSSKKIKLIYLILAIFSFLYILIRAIKVDITYDEAWTIKDFVSHSFMNIINYTPCDANNHIINTLLIKLFFAFGDHSLFIARLPNVLAFIIYLYYSYRIANNLITGFIGLSAFLLLILNPFLLDFFSLARGYGLSMAFQSASLYFLLLFFKEKKPRQSLLALMYGGLAVLCNFSVLNYWLVILFVTNALPFIFRKEFNLKKNIINSVIITIPLLLLIYEPIRKLKKNGNLYYGGEDGFYPDTLVSLTKYSLYSPEISSAVYILLDLFLIFLIGSVIGSFYRSRFVITSLKNVLLCVFILCISSIVIQHYLFGTLYLIDRTALFFYPIMILLLCFSLNEHSRTWYSKTVVFIAVISFGVNYFMHANFYKTATWYFDSHTISILEQLNEKGKEKNKKLRLDYSWPFQSSIGYYYNKHDYPFLELVQNKNERESIQATADFYIYLDRSLEKVGYDANAQKIISLAKDTVCMYQEEGIYVFTNIK